MAIKPFAIQGADLKLGGVNLQAGTTGVVIPGVTHATTRAVEEVNDTGDQTQTFTNGIYEVIDQVIYDVLSADNTSDITAYAVYILNLDDQNYIDSIEVDSRGSYTDAESTTNESNNMWAYLGTTSYPTSPGSFVASDWIQVPFRPRMRAGEVVTDGGGSSLPLARFAGYLHTDGIGTLTWIPDTSIGGGGSVNQLTSGTAVLSLDEYGTLTFSNLLDAPVGQTIQNYGMGNLFAWQDGSYWTIATGDPDTGNYGLTGIGISPGIESSTYLLLPSDVDSTTTSVSLGNVSGGVQIQTSGKDWTFTNSNLIVPSYAVIATPPVNGNGVYAESYYDSTGAWGSYIQQDITDSTSTWAWIETNLNSNIPTVFVENQSADGTNVRWTFDEKGALTLPLAHSVIQSVGAGTNTNVTIIASTGSNTSTWTFGSTGTLILPQTNAITSARSRRVGRKITGIETYSAAGAPYRYVWNNTTNFLSLYYIGSGIIGWTFYTDSSSTVTITGIDPLGPWSLAFSGDPGPGPYTAQSPDYVPGHDNPVNIVAGNNTWTFDISGQLTVPGDIVPFADNTHDLGTQDKQWRHIYVSTGSIYLGGVKLSTNNNQLSVQQVTNIGGQETVVQNYALTNADRLVSGNKTLSINSDGIISLPNGSLAVGLNHGLNITAGGSINIVSDQGSSLVWSNASVQDTPGEILDAYVYAQGDGGAGLELFYRSLDGIGDTVNSWSLDTNGNLVTTIARVNNPDNSFSYTAGDIVGPDGRSIIHLAASETTPEYAPEGRLWFNSEEGRLYIRYNNQWVDASPTVLTPSSVYLGNITAEGDTFTINNSTLTIDETGTLLVNGTQVSGGGVANTGDIQFNGSTIYNTTDSKLIIDCLSSNGDNWVQLQGGTSGSGPELNWYDGTDTRRLWTNGIGTTIQNQNGNNPSLEWLFDTDGVLNLPDDIGDIKRNGLSVLGGGGFATTSTLVNGTYTVALSTTGQLNLPSAANTESSNARIQSASSIDILSNLSLWNFGQDGVLTLSTASIILGTGQDPNVYVETVNNGTTSTWSFGINGILTLPAATPIIKGGGTGTDVTIIASTGSNTSTWTFGADGKTSLASGVEIANRNSFNFVTWNTGTALIIADNAETSASYIYIPSSSETSAAIGIVNTNTGGAVLLEQGGNASNNTLQVDSRGVSIVTTVNNLQTGNWLFGADGRTTLPIATTPATSKGAAGDKAGMIAVNSTSIFYCIANFTPLPNSVTVDVAGGDGGGSGLAAHFTTVPEAGWTLNYNGQSSLITTVNPQGDWYVVFWTDIFTIPLDAVITYGPSPLANIWVKQAWGTTGTW